MKTTPSADPEVRQLIEELRRELEVEARRLVREFREALKQVPSKDRQQFEAGARQARELFGGPKDAA